MGKSREKKTAKGRLDKWYSLAKEQGYRARSAFKLIQLNKKYDFLSSSKCTIDLCAAPGGWLQVAAKYMPQNTVIVGVDLVAIKPIPRCVTLTEDITTESCRRALRAEVKDWKADVVLHDGAPNVGSAWVQDAFTQAELVLSSLKLATEFLARGGTFVTKVFRSKDYNSLIWVFNQLFSKVEATKPPSSRNVSAEIFVVCTGYLAPKHIDPKFLDPKHVFEDLDLTPMAAITAGGEGSTTKLNPTSLNVFKPEKKRKMREGYADDDLTLFHSAPVLDFIRAADPIAVLGTLNALRFGTSAEEKQLEKSKLTTTEVKETLGDLKVLGKKDFKNLLKWRLAVREEMGLDVKVSAVPDATEEEVELEPLDEEAQIDADLENMSRAEQARRKKLKRAANEARTKNITRMQLGMATPHDVGLERHDGVDMSDMFDLGEVEGKRGVRKGVKLGSEEVSSDEEDDDELAEDEDEDLGSDAEELDDDALKARRLEKSLDAGYEAYQEHLLSKDARHKVKEQRRKRDALTGEWRGIGEENSEDEESEEEDIMDKFPAPASDSSDSEDEEDEEESRKERLLTQLKKPKKEKEKSRAAEMWFDQPVFKGMEGLMQFDDEAKDGSSSDASYASASEGEEEDEEESDEEEEVEMDEDEEEDDFEGAREELRDDSDAEEEADLAAQVKEELAKEKRIAAVGLTTAEAMSLAQALVNKERTKGQMIDDGFNRHAFNVGGDGLPAWFLDDEQKHFRHNIPITKDAVNAIREKMKALNARPIKKVAEAKARKKMRTIRRMEKVRARAQGVNDNDDDGLTEKEKASSIAKILAKGVGKKAPPKKDIKVVVARGANRGIKGRPSGVKGRYRILDPRQKKELRSQRRIAKRDKKGGGRRK